MTDLRTAKFNAPFGGEIRPFQLDIPRLQELEELCDAGPERIMNRLLTDQWRVDEIRHTIRLGLIGGGMEPTRAAVMIERYASEAYLTDLKPLAVKIVAASIMGIGPDNNVLFPQEMDAE